MPLDDMTPEQLRALADEREAEKPEVYDPIAPTGRYSVSALGMDIEVDVSRLDDFELIEDIRKVQDGDVMLTPSVVRRILGDAQMDRVIAGLKDRNPDHRATMADMLKVIEAVFTSNAELKN